MPGNWMMEKAIEVSSIAPMASRLFTVTSAGLLPSGVEKGLEVLTLTEWLEDGVLLGIVKVGRILEVASLVGLPE